MEITGKNIYDLLVARGYGEVITEAVLTEVINDINEQTVFEKKMRFKEQDNNILKAINILKANNIEKIEICQFGVFCEYECAGEKINVDILDGVDIDQESYDKLYDLLEFIDEDYIYNVLGYGSSGQNKLILTHDGFKCEEFEL